MPEDTAAVQTTRFGPLTIRYDEHGLRPRAWTELQARWGSELLGSLPTGAVLELCAGVGHIGLLAVAGSDRRLVQVEEVAPLCRLAVHNAAGAGVADRVEVREGQLEDVLQPDERFALVIADPPWVPSAEVGDHPEDPPSAIDGDSDGLEVVRAMVPVQERHLLPGGAVLLQLGGPHQVDAVREELVSTSSPLRVVEHRLAAPGVRGAVAQLR